MAMSPSARTLALLRKNGWTADITERFISQTRTRKDLFGCIDIAAVRPGETLGVQATSGSNVSARIKKLQEVPGAKAWLEGNNRLEVHGWRKLAKPVGRTHWQCRIVELVLVDGEVLPKEEV